jgi:hypothetical protein
MNYYRDPMTVKEAADIAGCDPRIILAACHARTLAHRRWNKRNFSIRRSDLIEWLKGLDFPRLTPEPAQPKQPA